MRNERKASVQILGALTDYVTFLLGMYVTIWFFDKIYVKLTDELRVNLVEYYLLMAVCALVVVIIFEDYQQFFKRTRTDELIDAVRVNIILMVISSIALIITKNSMIQSRYVFISVYPFNTVLILCSRSLFKRFMKRSIDEKMGAGLIGILTTHDKAKELIQDIRTDWFRQIRGIGIVNRDMSGETIEDIPIVSSDLNSFTNWVVKEALDEVVVDVAYEDDKSKDRLKDFVEELKKMGVVVHFNLAMMNRFSEYYESVTYFGHTPMLTLENTHYDFRSMLMKRMMDIIGGVIGCIISVPIICVTAVPLLIESKGPLIFKQKRVGLNGRSFYMYKLRSMYEDAEEHKAELMKDNEVSGLMFKMTDDPRITKVGRFIRRTSIDELPQFFNVVKGDMSLVGTRPPTMDEFNQYKNYHKRRLSMKPGITGMWQISGRSEINDFEDVVKMDLLYIDSWSLSLDLRIIFKTMQVVFRKKGAK